ncbi:FtsQ-type POTRA domain-containing protein [Frondihabitans cladoniiphilus]|uniref:FtsQ-type POTRA domain-containing protein n=1 Tax=Frondihabitans cladoniiphilus TaxID=715785 RepID=UPI0031EBB1E5
MPDTSADEARERARETRRAARRAAAERRAVERTEVRRFTRRTRHRRAGWITAGAIVVVLVGGVTLGVFSPLLSLQTISVQGTSRVDRGAVLTSLKGQVGKPLALIDFGAVKSDLSNFPLIESYVTETKPPHTLVIRITERQPIASVLVGKTYELVDPAGVIITTSTTQPADVPLVDVKGATLDGNVYRAAAEVLLSLPTSLRTTVKGVSASTADDVTLMLSTGEEVVWGSAEASTQKAELLTGLIKSHKATNPTQSVEYDVSAPDNGIIRTK